MLITQRHNTYRLATTKENKKKMLEISNVLGGRESFFCILDKIFEFKDVLYAEVFFSNRVIDELFCKWLDRGHSPTWTARLFAHVDQLHHDNYPENQNWQTIFKSSEPLRLHFPT